MRSFFSSGLSWARRFGGILAIAFLACQQKSPEEELLKQAEPVGSWLATLQMAGEKWAANSVPTSFLKNSVSAAGKEFEKVGAQAAKSRARPEIREPLRSLIADSEAASAGLRRAVEANDRSGAAREVGRVAALHARFMALMGRGS
jgi:hypothetical protein